MRLILFVLLLLCLLPLNVLAEEDGECDAACRQQQFDEDPSPANYERLEAPGLSDFQKLDESEQTPETFGVLARNEQQTHLSDPSVIQSQPDLFQQYMGERGIEVLGVKGRVQSFENDVLVANNMRLDLTGVDDISFGIDQGGNVYFGSEENPIVAENAELDFIAGPGGGLELKVKEGGSLRGDGELAMLEEHSASIVCEVGCEVDMDDYRIFAEEEEVRITYGQPRVSDFFGADAVQGVVIDKNNDRVLASGEGFTVSREVSGNTYAVTFDDGGFFGAEDGWAVMGRNSIDMAGDEVDFAINDQIIFQIDSEGEFYKKTQNLKNLAETLEEQTTMNVGFWEQESEERLFRHELNLFAGERKEPTLEEMNRLKDRVAEAVNGYLKSDPRRAAVVKKNLEELRSLAQSNLEQQSPAFRNAVNDILANVDTDSLEIAGNNPQVFSGLKTLMNYDYDKLEGISDEQKQIIIDNAVEMGEEINMPELVTVARDAFFEEGDSYRLEPGQLMDTLQSSGLEISGPDDNFYLGKAIEEARDSKVFVDVIDDNVYFNVVTNNGFKYPVDLPFLGKAFVEAQPNTAGYMTSDSGSIKMHAANGDLGFDYDSWNLPIYIVESEVTQDEACVSLKNSPDPPCFGVDDLSG